MKFVEVQDVFDAEIPDQNQVFYDEQNISLTCPCGCGNWLRLPRIGSIPDRPQWDLVLPNSITPSVNLGSGCKSHFFITNGQVIWCK